MTRHAPKYAEDGFVEDVEWEEEQERRRSLYTKIALSLLLPAVAIGWLLYWLA